MNKKRKQYAKKAGMLPGTLVYTGSFTNQPTVITRIEYNSDQIDAKKNATAEEACAPLSPTASTWLHVAGFTNISLIEEVGTHFGIHRLLLEDVLNVEQPPKVVDQGNDVFITLKHVTINPDNNQMGVEQINLLIGTDYLISFREQSGGLVDYVLERLTTVPQSRSRGVGYLLYLICDRIVDQYFVVLESFENKLDEMEETLLQHPEKFRTEKLHQLRKEFSWLRRQVSPLQEEFRKLTVGGVSAIHEPIQIYMRDVYDHLMQVSHTMENFRETYSSLLDFYVAQSDLRMNQIMKRLTVVATVFMPLGFIAAFYGMNFTNMPELNSAWGYPMVIAVMVLTTIGMLWWLRWGKFK